MALCAAVCRHRWLANLTMHPHAKRCTYLRNGALHARRAFTLERVFNDTCTISDPYERGVSVHLYLYPCLFYLSHASLLSTTYRYSPYVTRSPWFRSCTIIPPRGFYLFPLPPPVSSFSIGYTSLLHVHRVGKRNKRREKEEGSDEGDGRKREKSEGRGRGERERESGAIIWYPWLVSGSASRRQGRLCWIYL